MSDIIELNVNDIFNIISNVPDETKNIGINIHDLIKNNNNIITWIVKKNKIDHLKSIINMNINLNNKIKII